MFYCYSVTRVAAIDCGTNSIRLLIADVAGPGGAGVDAGGALQDVHREMRVVRLGQGVDRTGQLDPQALERTLAACADYAALCQEHGVAALRFIATSATRDASNREAFFNGVHQRLGVLPEVISGQEEARLSFAGALSVLDPNAASPRLIVDLGGGSTELALGHQAPEHTYSMNVGCVRMTERHLADGVTNAQARAAIEADVNQALDEAAGVIPFAQVGVVVGLAGTITTVTAQALGLPRYDPSAINGAQLTLPQALAAVDELWHMSRQERAALGFMHPGRVDVIAAGALVWATVLRRVQREVSAAGGELTHTITSEHDILDGIALSIGPR